MLGRRCVATELFYCLAGHSSGWELGPLPLGGAVRDRKCSVVACCVLAAFCHPTPEPASYGLKSP